MIAARSRRRRRRQRADPPARYYLENRQLTELADELRVTQSRASQLRAEGLELLHQALTVLLTEDSRAGAGASSETDPSEVAGVRARRRDAYVQAVATRSSVRDRADVQAYLNGAQLAHQVGIHPLGA